MARVRMCRFIISRFDRMQDGSVGVAGAGVSGTGVTRAGRDPSLRRTFFGDEEHERARTTDPYGGACSMLFSRTPPPLKMRRSFLSSVRL